MPLEKGTNLLHVRSFVVASEGDAAWTRVVASLDAADREALASLVAIGWYDIGLELRLFDAVDRVLGDGGGALLDELGRFEAEQDLTRIHRLFLRLASPAFVLEKAGEYWGRFHDTGTWAIERRGKTSAVGTLTGFVADARFCRYLSAYMVRMFELVGARSLAWEHPKCRARGDDACVFVGTWEEERGGW